MPTFTAKKVSPTARKTHSNEAQADIDETNSGRKLQKVSEIERHETVKIFDASVFPLESMADPCSDRINQGFSRFLFFHSLPFFRSA